MEQALFFVPFYNFSSSFFIVTLASLIHKSQYVFQRQAISDSLECYWWYTVTADFRLGNGEAERKRA
jgi:hypothetical protein